MNLSLLKKVLSRLPLKNILFFESIPDLGDNAFPVFEEMIRRGMNRQYKFVWLVSDCKKDLPRIANVTYIDRKTLLNRCRYTYYNWRSKALIYCNRFISKKNPKQAGFFLTHGTPIKDVADYYNLENIDVDYTLTAGEGTNLFLAKAIKFDPARCVALGFPRNDVLTAPPRDLHACFGGDFKKVIVWYPTFRQHKNGQATGSSKALPLLHDTKMARQLNEVAQKAGVLLVVKPHFAQEISYIKDHSLSNIQFIDDAFFAKNKISSYELVGSCDALLSDYSSIYYDFLLCDKPVGLIWEDIEEYRQSPGFAVDMDYYMKGAEKLYTLSDLEKFIQTVVAGKDPLKESRNEINRLVNYASDGKNTCRVVDFIIEKAGL